MHVCVSLGILNKLKTQTKVHIFKSFATCLLIFEEIMDFLTLGYIYQGNGRAFCAGGDVAAVANDARGGLFVFFFFF
jgi:hypothetical protein